MPLETCKRCKGVGFSGPGCTTCMTLGMEACPNCQCPACKGHKTIVVCVPEVERAREEARQLYLPKAPESSTGHWAEKYWTPENLCQNCKHPRSDHLGEAFLKGEPKRPDKGWTTKPPGTCIFDPCTCTAFVEPLEEEEEGKTPHNG